jgi:thiamine-phosphate pyrophosphorylase
MALSRGFLSIVDANCNRAKEGLRVIEDIARFLLRDKNSVSQAKKIRHSVSACVKLLSPKYARLLEARDSAKDTGRKLNPPSEFKRKNLREVLVSNFKRAEESLRVLEEVSKISGPKASAMIKELRYETYVLEKKLLLKMP